MLEVQSISRRYGERVALDGVTLPPDYALQHPQDWLDSLASACKSAMKLAKVNAEQVVGIGIVGPRFAWSAA